jgi:ankyrin repeat protein
MDGVMSACAGLLSFDEGSDVVRLIHHTAQEYLEHGTGKATGTGKTTPLPGAEAYIASICTTYLSFDEFETGFCATDADLEDRLSKHPLYGYAARNWGYHAHNASVLPSNNTSVRRLLMSVPKTEAAGQGMMAIKEQSPWAGYSQEAPSGTTALHLAARFGATDIVTDLLKNYGIRECDVRDSHSQSPLMWAVVFGNVDMVQMLLDAGADPNSKDKDGRTSLSLAAESGFTAIIEALLKNNRLDMGGDAQKDSVGRLPLSWAARNGHVDAVSALLARSDLERGQADNPLLWAILQDSEAVVKVIVEAALGNQGAGPGWGARIAPKALCWAAEIGRVPVFTYLLSALGGDVNCRSDEDMTPLMKAAQNGHEEMATALTLRLGADPSLSDGRGRTAFSLAAAYGHDSLVSLFLLHADTKIDLNGVEKDGRTPLSLAAGNGHQTIVQTLLELEGEVVDVDARDKARQTPMFWAARNGYSSIVRRLLETGKVDIDLANVYRQTALSEAVKGYHVAASEAIKEYHAATIEVLREYGAADLGTEPASPESGRSYLTLSTEGPLAGESENNDDSGEEAPETDWGYQSDEFE